MWKACRRSVVAAGRRDETLEVYAGEAPAPADPAHQHRTLPLAGQPPESVRRRAQEGGRLLGVEPGLERPVSVCSDCRLSHGGQRAPHEALGHPPRARDTRGLTSASRSLPRRRGQAGRLGLGAALDGPLTRQAEPRVRRTSRAWNTSTASARRRSATAWRSAAARQL